MKERGFNKVTLGIFDRVSQLKLSDGVKYTCDETMNLYSQYLRELKYLEDMVEFPACEREAFLTRMMKNDIKDNHVTENEEEFLIDLYTYLSNNSVIESLIDKRGGSITIEELKRYHSLLLMGTSSEDRSRDYLREDNDAFVGAYLLDGSKRIDYMPLDYEKIPEALELLVQFYNDSEIKDSSDILIKPFLFHSLVACLQLFNDGNTRLARVLQSAKMWNHTNQCSSLLLDGKGFYLSKPALYLTNAYKLYRGQYREIIKDLVTLDTDEVWNSWLRFNFYRTQESLNVQSNNLAKLRRAIKHHMG